MSNFLNIAQFLLVGYGEQVMRATLQAHTQIKKHKFECWHNETSSLTW